MPVESTRSQNITVTCRRSPADSGADTAFAAAVNRGADVAAGGGAFAFASARRAEMASSSIRRCPTTTTPRSVLRRQARQDLLIHLVFAERRLIPFETKAAQPTSEVHDSVLITRRLNRSGHTTCPGRSHTVSLRHLSMAAGLRTGKGAAGPSLPAAYSPTLAVITRPAAGTISSDGNHDLAEMLV